MNTALIFAGGSGIRMNAKAKPKQFLELNGRAIIIHTLEYFENHPEIDSICVVIIESWIDYLKELLERYSFKKVKWIVAGGTTGQESIFNGLQAIYNDNKETEDCIVLIHDGVRPLINDSLISNNIASVRKFRSAITVSPAIETIITANENNQIERVTDRKFCLHARAPQSFFLKDIYTAHKKALDENIHDMIDSASLMKYYGYKLYTVEGPVENIKITTPMDYYLFRAIYEARENSQIFGI
jgi:2-C-methyl-D-erythritol 4-phosphate cytidylyltransferase